MVCINTVVISIFVSAILFVCVEAPWANTEKWFFSIILGRTQKPKNT